MERGEERNQLNNYNLQVSFSSSSPANNIHELGFVHFADHNLSFLAPSSQSSQNLQAAAASVSVTPPAAINTTGGGIGFSHNELLVNRPSWSNNDQVISDVLKNYLLICSIFVLVRSIRNKLLTYLFVI